MNIRYFAIDQILLAAQGNPNPDIEERIKYFCIINKFYNSKLTDERCIVGGKVERALGANGQIYLVNYGTGQVWHIMGGELDWCDVWPC